MECWLGGKFFGVALVFVVEVFFVDEFSVLFYLDRRHGFVCEHLFYEASLAVFFASVLRGVLGCASPCSSVCKLCCRGVGSSGPGDRVCV